MKDYKALIANLNQSVGEEVRWIANGELRTGKVERYELPSVKRGHGCTTIYKISNGSELRQHELRDIFMAMAEGKTADFGNGSTIVKFVK